MLTFSVDTRLTEEDIESSVSRGTDLVGGLSKVAGDDAGDGTGDGMGDGTGDDKGDDTCDTGSGEGGTVMI